MALGGLNLGKFGGREKALVILVVMAGLGVGAYPSMIRTRAEQVKKAKRAYEKTQAELHKLEAQRPNVDARRTQIQTMREQVASTYKELEGLEEGLLGRDDFDVLLHEVEANHQRYHLTINSVKPMRRSCAL